MKNKIDRSVGIIPVYKSSQEPLFLLVQQNAEYWGLPKGHPEEGESDIDAAKRELWEETGISEINIIEGKTYLEKYSFNQGSNVYNKTVTYYIGLVKNIDNQIPEKFKNEIIGTEWLSFKEAYRRINFSSRKKVIKWARDLLK